MWGFIRADLRASRISNMTEELTSRESHSMGCLGDEFGIGFVVSRTQFNNFDDLNVFSESIFRSEANSVLSSSMLNVATMFQTKNDTQNPRRVS